MGIRISKSIMLNFSKDLEPLFIFAGLALLLVIGPLLRLYVLSMMQSNFKLKKKYILELVPFLIVFIISFFVEKNWFNENNKQAVIVFGSIIIFIYTHFAFYIFITGRIWRIEKRNFKKTIQTKFQKAIFDWIQLLIIGFSIIWLSFFFNIIEETIPYIVGPVMYSIVVYFLSFKVFKLKVLDLDGEVFKLNDNARLFNQICLIVEERKLYIESDMSLSSLSVLIGGNTQKTSEVINQYGNQNFNDFINNYRIEEAKKLLLNKDNDMYTISSIAFDVGFNSLSTFNVAFKKFVGITPSSFKKQIK